MNEPPDQLYAVEFSSEEQARLQDFSCGDEPWSRDVAAWIQGAAALASAAKGTRIWLFETEPGEIVGFGSVGPARWRWPLPDGPHTNLVLIPMLGIDRRFQGQPPDPDRRYAIQIMRHLIDQARMLASEISPDPARRSPSLLLMVHQLNARAIRFYERCGFETIPNVTRGRNSDHLVMKFALFPE